MPDIVFNLEVHPAALENVDEFIKAIENRSEWQIRAEAGATSGPILGGDDGDTLGEWSVKP